MGTGFSSANSRKWSKKEAPNPESSRILFLLYLIHRTWNVVVEHMDSKSGRWRGSHTVPSSGEGLRHFDSVSLDSGGSCYSACSCSYCRLRDCAQDCIRYVGVKFFNAMLRSREVLFSKLTDTFKFQYNVFNELFSRM